MFDPKLPYNDLPLLPGDFDFQQKQFLKPLIQANQALAKLDWLTLILPNYEVLIHPLLTKESVASNEIENINTTMMDFLQQEAIGAAKLQWAEKEVEFYRAAVIRGVEEIAKRWGISVKLLVDLQAMIEPHRPWIRKIPGTVIANSTGTVLYTPPQGENVIKELLYNLEEFIHAQDDIDPLIKVWIIHHQFESIHPFYDGNGRIGRILILLYLILTKKITKPVLFLSAYILSQKNKYYASFDRQGMKWMYENMIAFMLDGIWKQSQATQEKIIAIHNLMDATTKHIKNEWFRDYHLISQLLFSYPFMTVQSFADSLWVTRQSASELIKKLETKKIIKTTRLKNSKLLYLPSFIEIIK